MPSGLGEASLRFMTLVTTNLTKRLKYKLFPTKLLGQSITALGILRIHGAYVTDS